MNERLLGFLFLLVLSCIGIWLIGSFITWNLSWFYDTLEGRLLSLGAFLAAIKVSYKTSE